MAKVEQKKQKPDLPASTLRIMERMVKTPPKPHEKAVKIEAASVEKTKQIRKP